MIEQLHSTPMKKAVYFLLLALLLAGAFLAGSWYNQRTVDRKNATGGRKALYYVDPMHPAYRSDKPGIAPDCGMQLEAVYAGGADNGSSSPASGAVKVSPERQQLIGVRVTTVERASGTHALRLFGRVAADETRVYRLIAGADGFVRQISPVTTGSRVEKDQWLATFSSPEARAPIQGYLVTLDVIDRQKQGGADAPAQIDAANASVQLAVDRLLNLGMSGVQIEQIRRTRIVPPTVDIRAPAAGFVLARNVSTGQRFEKGAEWYRIADLSRVWILADVFGNQAQYLRPGLRAQVSLPDQRKSLAARVSEVLPQFDANTRTLKVRLEMDNPGYTLRPDMFVDVELPVSFAPTVAVPVDAVLDSGLAKTVFVDRGEGFFEPRPVETGWRFGGQVEIVKGLAPGERIVTAGNFLLDSESRMKQAAAGLQAKDPACGMDVAAGKTTYTSEYAGKHYYFCSGQCKQQFDKAPERYLKRAAASASGPQS